MGRLKRYSKPPQLLLVFAHLGVDRRILRRGPPTIVFLLRRGGLRFGDERRLALIVGTCGAEDQQRGSGEWGVAHGVLLSSTGHQAQGGEQSRALRRPAIRRAAQRRR